MNKHVFDISIICSDLFILLCNILPVIQYQGHTYSLVSRHTLFDLPGWYGIAFWFVFAMVMFAFLFNIGQAKQLFDTQLLIIIDGIALTLLIATSIITNKVIGVHYNIVYMLLLCVLLIVMLYNEYLKHTMLLDNYEGIMEAEEQQALTKQQDNIPVYKWLTLITFITILLYQTPIAKYNGQVVSVLQLPSIYVKIAILMLFIFFVATYGSLLSNNFYLTIISGLLTVVVPRYSVLMIFLGVWGYYEMLPSMSDVYLFFLLLAIAYFEQKLLDYDIYR